MTESSKDVILEVTDLKKHFPTLHGTVKAVDGIVDDDLTLLIIEEVR